MTAANDHDLSFACVMSTAEHELGAFMSAVTGLYGSEQARISAEDWIDEFESLNVQTQLTTRAWRRITIATAVRLANRLSELGVPSNFEHRNLLGVTMALRTAKSHEDTAGSRGQSNRLAQGLDQNPARQQGAATSTERSDRKLRREIRRKTS